MNLTDEAESLMLHQFKNSPRLVGLMRALVAHLEELTSNLGRLRHGRYIEEAKGRRLDILGHIVGQPRDGMVDDDYRAWIKVAIKLNRSSGTPEDVLSIFRILLGPKTRMLVHEYPPNDVVFTFFDYPMVPLKALFDITRSAVPAGSSCHFVQADKALAFSFDKSSFSEARFAEFF